MKQNMGQVDRIIRALLAVTIAVLFFIGQISGVAATVLGVIAIVFFFTSLVGSCPLYRVVGLSTKKAKTP